MVLQFSLTEYTIQSGADGLMVGNLCSEGIWGGRGGLLDGGGKKGNPKSSTHKANCGAMSLLRPWTLPLESSKSHRKMLSESVMNQGWVLIK